MEQHLETAKQKLLEALETWCIHYKLLGSPGETPRYSQILNDWYDNEDEEFYLKSTVCRIYYKLNLTPEESLVLRRMESNTRWAWWKQIRTEYLIENHPTINPY